MTVCHLEGDRVAVVIPSVSEGLGWMGGTNTRATDQNPRSRSE